MHSPSFHYEEKDQNLPEIPVYPHRNEQAIGKILSRYQMRKPSPIAHQMGKNFSVHTGTALNYSQIYNDLKIKKTNNVNSDSILNAEQDTKQEEYTSKQSDQILKKMDQIQFTSSPYHFQSSTTTSKMGRKILPSFHNNRAQEQNRKSFRINEFKDQQNKKINYQEVSDIYMSGDDVKSDKVKSIGSEPFFKAKMNKQIGKLTDRFKINQVEHKEYYEEDSDHVEKKEEEVKKDVGYQNQGSLKQSRSIGVGHHRIRQQDLYKSFHEDEQVEQQVIENPIKKEEKSGKGVTEQEQQKQSAHFKEPEQGIVQNIRESFHSLSKHDSMIQHNAEINKDAEVREISVEDDKKQAKDSQNIIVHFPEIDRIQVQSNKIVNNQSNVASTIKGEQGKNVNIQLDDQFGDNLLNGLDEMEKNLPEQQKPQKIPEPEDYVAKFRIQKYSEVYPVLRDIKGALKASLINVQEVVRGIKQYLQIIASGNLDNIDEFNLPLHKKKIVKTSLFYERVSIIVLAFAYTSHSIKQSHKFLLNIMGYSLNNSLMLVKVLEDSQIGHGRQDHRGNVFEKSQRLIMKRNLDTLRNNNDVLFDSIQKLSKNDEVFYENLKQIMKVIHKSSLEQTFYNILEYFSFYLCVSQLDNMIPFLAVAPNPYLSPTLATSKYTLVIDVMELFCLGTKKSKTNVFRPYSQHFLHEMNQYYEIVSFCSAFPNQIDKVIDMLDPKGYIQHRLYKHHAVNKNKVSLKEIDRIGRDLDHMILLDNQNAGGRGSFDNCIHVPGWKGSKNDTVLAQLCPLLAMISLKRVRAPEAIKKVREQSMKNKQNGVKYINFGVSLD